MTKKLMIVDDDVVFVGLMARAMEARDYEVQTATSVTDALATLDEFEPTHAIVDLRLPDGNGLAVIERLAEHDTRAHAVVLTGYGNIPTAVSAAKLGAVDYLAKPVDADEVDAALQSTSRARGPVPQSIIPPDEARVQHILELFEKNDRNVSRTAHQLEMHRRTLQRILRRAGIEPLDTPTNDQPNAFARSRRLFDLWSRVIPAGEAPAPSTGLDTDDDGLTRV